MKTFLELTLTSLAVLAGGLSSCDREDATHTLQLLDGIGTARIDRSPGSDAPVEEKPDRVEAAFSSGQPCTWLEGRQVARILKGLSPGDPTAQLAQDDDDGFLLVPPRSGGIFWEFPSAGEAALVATVVTRVPAADGAAETLPQLTVHALAEPPTDILQSRSLAPRLTERAATALQTEWIQGLPLHTEWRETSVLLKPHPEQRGWRIGIQPGSAPLEVTHFRVRELTALESVLSSPRMIGEHDISRFRRKLHTCEEAVDCLILPGTFCISFETPRASGTLDFRYGSVASSSAPRPRITVLVDGSPAWQSTPDPVGNPEDLSLTPAAIPVASATQVTFRCDANPGEFAVIATPRVLLGSPPRRPNVVLISVDTLRPDYLSCYGFPYPTSPAIDDLAAHGVLFERAFSPTCYTLPAHATILTGEHPLEHGLVHPVFRLSGSSTTLAQLLRAQGYITRAFTGGGFLNPDFGFQNGFDAYGTSEPGGVRERFGARPPDFLAHQRESMKKVLAWIQRFQHENFFLFFHTYFVHNYVVDPSYLARTESLFPPHDCQANLQDLWDSATSNPDAAIHIRHAYAAAVLQMDEQILAPLIAQLRDSGILENTLVFLVSDHGEEFLEHGGIGHGNTLFSELVRVPLLCMGPSIPAGQRDSRMVGLRAIAPTILDLVRVPYDPSLFSVPSLFSGQTQESVVFYHENLDLDTEWRGIAVPPWKFVSSREGNVRHQYLFLLGDHDRTDYMPYEEDLARSLELELEQESSALSVEHAPVQSTLPTQVEDELEALGYLDR